MNRPRKRFGQHFLQDANVVARILRALDPQPGDHFVEIGPGEGAITLPLLGRVRRLDAVEIDRDLAGALPARAADPRLRVHCADALRFDFRSLAVCGERLRLAGNLPYNISTPLLFHLLAQRAVFADLHVMLQKEVGERMTAAPGSRTYGRLTVALAVRCSVERLFTIRPGSFRPPPAVDSVFLRLVPLAGAPGERQLQCLDRLLTRAFTLRRKRLSNALAGLAGVETIAAAGIDPGLRPENLTPADWLLLADLTARSGALANPGNALSE